jgi:hypothetical protein
MTVKQEKLIKKLQNYWYISFFQLLKLPAAKFVGVKVKSINEHKAEVTLPYRWSSKNPFQSIYFAALCAASEFSTGLLVLVGIEKHGNFSMLVRKFEAEFVKKANTKITFICEDNVQLQEKIDSSHLTKEGFEVVLKSIGYNESKEIVCIMHITWGLKSKS